MSFARRASSFPLPASGERVASADRREPGEGAFQKRSALRRRPLTRLLSLRSAIDLSPHAGRGEAELAA